MNLCKCLYQRPPIKKLGKEKYLILLAQLQNHLCLVALSRWGVDESTFDCVVASNDWETERGQKD